MSEHKRDLRIVKTKKVVFNTMLSLMSRQKFARITVNELCEEALISRATFYAHFNDKYDLLKLWLTSYVSDVYDEIKKAPLEKREEYGNVLVCQNKRILESLLLDADNETIGIVSEVILSFSSILADKNKVSPEYIVLSNIYTGGIISYLQWQTKNKFPKEVEVFNVYLCEAIKRLLT